MGSNFIRRNPDFSINSLPIKAAFESTGSVSSLEHYCSNVVMRMGEDARDFIINIVPIVLRISIEVIYVDEKNRVQGMQH